jgi:hypothetical protein
LCNDCRRSFVPQKVKGKSFPLGIILEGLSFYNTGFTLEESCQKLKEQFGIGVKPSALFDWVKEFDPLCRYGRLRPYGLKLYSPTQVIQTVHLILLITASRKENLGIVALHGKRIIENVKILR